MSLDSNSGTQIYLIPCGVPSSTGVQLLSNTGSRYYWLSANDYILYGQPAFYPQSATNTGTVYYLLQCNVPSTSGINVLSNKGTAYYYSSSFNCVTFCD